ncbi:MAG: diguanylate cyclase [Deltaproteobacteria bacterium]|nr:diguanylate cyclase [Deltaproteobacteria bacterium]
MPLWSRSDRSARDEELELLRQASIFLLARLAETVPPDHVDDLRRVAERLARPPVPTGLMRELKKVAVVTPRTRGTSAALPELAAEAARQLAHVMSVACLIDDSLSEAVKEFRDGIPVRLGVSEARRLERQGAALLQTAAPARERAIRRQEEVTAMISDLGRELASLSSQGATVAAEAKDLVSVMEEVQRTGDLQTARAALVGRVRALGQSAGSLHGELMEARARSAQLEERLIRKEAELLDVRSSAALDGLTGLLHRGSFNKAIVEDIRRAEMMHHPLALVMLDIDHFKAVNDTWGHQMGDKVLEGLAFVLRHHVRGSDRAARYGGEEFALILSGANHRVSEAVAERIRVAVAALQFETESAVMGVTISCGVAVLGPGEGPASLVGRADKALYAAKHGGRDQVVMAIPAPGDEASRH